MSTKSQRAVASLGLARGLIPVTRDPPSAGLPFLIARNQQRCPAVRNPLQFLPVTPAIPRIFGAQLRRTAPHAFWIYDRRLVIVETISEELWLQGAEDVELYERAWDWLAESAEYGATARRLIGRARASLDLS